MHRIERTIFSVYFHCHFAASFAKFKVGFVDRFTIEFSDAWSLTGADVFLMIELSKRSIASATEGKTLDDDYFEMPGIGKKLNREKLMDIWLKDSKTKSWVFWFICCICLKGHAGDAVIWRFSGSKQNSQVSVDVLFMSLSDPEENANLSDTCPSV